MKSDAGRTSLMQVYECKDDDKPRSAHDMTGSAGPSCARLLEEVGDPSEARLNTNRKDSTHGWLLGGKDDSKTVVFDTNNAAPALAVLRNGNNMSICAASSANNATFRFAKPLIEMNISRITLLSAASNASEQVFPDTRNDRPRWAKNRGNKLKSE